MKSPILEAADMVVQHEGRIARTLGALGMAAAIATGQPAMGEPGVKTTTTAVQKAGTSKITFSNSFVDFVKQVENAGKKGWNKDDQKWYPHDSPEGGSQTIAYGHKLNGAEEEKRFAKGITEQEALALLRKDLDRAWNVAASYVKAKHDVELSSLSEKQQEILTEYAFNLGTLRGFPKFVQAVVGEDWDAAKKEYKRTYKDTNGVRHELTRNTFFYNRYLK